MAAKKKTDDRTRVQKVLEFFPNLRHYLLDEDGVYGTEIRDLLFKAYREKWSDDKFIFELRSTNYFNRADESQRAFDEIDPATKRRNIELKARELTSQFGNVFGTFDRAKVIAREILRNNMPASEAAYYVYERLREAGNRDILYDSVDAQKARQLARKYMYEPSYAEIESLLLGEIMPVDFENRLRARAKVDYPHLASAFDQGLTPMDVAEPRRRIASRLLERPEDEIDFTNPMFMRLLDRSAVNDGPMSLTEVSRMVKSDPQYGYQYTTQANQEATSLGSMIAKMFGARA